MTQARVIFHRLAAREYRAAREWYATRSVEASLRFRAAVDAAANRIATDAEALPGLFDDYRYLRAGRIPYVLIFRRLSANQILVLAVAHTSRRFGYWRRRK
jgi:plasmid stabilization system protein ParE